MRTILIIMTFILMKCFLIHADDASEFKDLIKNTYDFYPSQLSREQQKEKMPALDSFFQKVLSDKEKYLPLLRKELQDFSNNAYFLFDGSALLFKEAKDKNDLQICADALGQVHLEDMDGAAYLFFSIDLGKNGCDIYPSIQKILDYPKFSAFIAEHSMTLGQTLSAMYCCLQIDDSLYVDKLIKRLQSEENPGTAKSIILVLGNTVSVKAQNALNEIANKTNKEELKQAILKYKYNKKSELPAKEKVTLKIGINKLLDAFKEREYLKNEDINKQIFKGLPYYVTKKDYDKIKRIRREIAYRISDEAMKEILFLTYLLKLSFTSDE